VSCGTPVMGTAYVTTPVVPEPSCAYSDGAAGPAPGPAPAAVYPSPAPAP
jgi:hypothetical protein